MAREVAEGSPMPTRISSTRSRITLPTGGSTSQKPAPILRP